MTSNETEYWSTWVPEPNGRGTWSIIYSCVFTLVLCVYSAIHINIPAKGESDWVQFLRNAKWVLIAIFAPEVVLYAAWQQYYHAKKFCWELYLIRLKQEGWPAIDKPSWWEALRRRFKRKNGDKPDGPKEPRGTSDAHTLNGSDKTKAAKAYPPPFSLTYGFYVVMGGLTVDVSDIYDNADSVTMTAGGVLLLTQHTSWKRLMVPDATICDKSKADNLAKLLILLQVSWTIFQCASRRVGGLPLTTLEVHTLVHAACAMMMFIAWFHKPLNIRDPTVVDCSNFEDELVLALMRSGSTISSPFNNLNKLSGYIAKGMINGKERIPHYELKGEASRLLFDTERLNVALEGLHATSGATMSILHSNTLHEAAEQEQGKAPADKPGGIYRSVSQGEVPVAIVATGETLWNGVGPTACTSGPPKMEPSLFRRKEGTARSFVDPVLQRLIYESRCEPGPGAVRFEVLYHRVTYELSAKDLLRWQRAGSAFARELVRNSTLAGPGSDTTTPQNRDEDGRDDAGEMASGLTHVDEETTGSPRNETSHTAHVTESNTSFTQEKSGDAKIAQLKTAEIAKEEGQKTHREPSPRLLTLYQPPTANAELFRESVFRARSKNFPSLLGGKILGTPTRSVLTIGSLSLVCGAYSSIHLALWNYVFPSNTEMLLWKISGCALAFPAVFLPILLVQLRAGIVIMAKLDARHAQRHPDDKPEDAPSKRWDRAFTAVNNVLKGELSLKHLPSSAAGWPAWWRNCFEVLDKGLVLGAMSARVLLISALMFSLFGFALLYVVARLYIVVESFLSLRLVPSGVYQDVEWPRYIPHF